MVMSQGAIDALMAAGAEGATAEENERADAPGDEEIGALTDEERAIVAAAAEEETEESAPAEVIPAAEPDEPSSPKMRTWSASATSQTDQLRDRVQDLEDKLSIIETSTMGAPEADPAAMAEIRQSLEQLTTTVQSLWSSVHQLTEHSQGSLGFAAKQTFDCPECGSHGTVAVPIRCTKCGFESEWGFFPEE